MHGLEVILAAIFASAAAAPPIVRRFGTPGALVLSFLPIGGFLCLIAAGPTSVRRPWFEGLGAEWFFRHEGLGALFALMILGIGALIMLYAVRYAAEMRGRDRLWGLLLAFMGSMLGLVWAGNALLLFVFWELTSVTSWLLIGIDARSAQNRRNAQQALLVTGAGGLALLAGLLGLIHARGTADLALLAAPGPTPDWAAAAILAGCFAKSAQVPLHFWLPNAMSAPTPVSAYLHSATMVKAGIYLLAVLAPGLPGWAMKAMIGFGAATMVVGSFLAVTQSDLKRMLASTTVAALGVLVMLVGFGPEARLAFALFLVAHALYKAAGFMIVGAIEHGTGTRDVRELGNVAGSMRGTAATALAFSLAAAGAIGTLGYLAKSAIGQAISGPAKLGVTVFSLVGALIAGAIVGALFVGRGPRREAHEDFWLAASPLALAVASFLFAGGGWAPTFGFPAPPSEVRIDAVGLILTIVAFALGLGYRPIQAAAARATAIPISADRTYDRIMEGLFALSNGVARLFQHGLLRHDLAIVFVGATATVALTLAAGHEWFGEWRLKDARFVELSLAVLAAAAAVRAVFVPGRLTAVILLGIVGITIGAVFLLFGAPDLVLTQLLVETLTVVLFVLVFRSLPKFKRLSSPAARLRDATVALVFGALMTTLVLESTAAIGSRPASDYFAAASLPEAKGRNVVNTILVDFRALDTLGEIVVVCLAAFGVYALLHLRHSRRTQ
jgi:multicomponent Na+:H+ antiporter subunit A